MTITIQLTDKEKLEAMYDYIYSRGVIVPGMACVSSYVSIGQFTYTDEPEETPDGD